MSSALLLLWPLLGKRTPADPTPGEDAAGLWPRGPRQSLRPEAGCCSLATHTLHTRHSCKARSPRASGSPCDSLVCRPQMARPGLATRAELGSSPHPKTPLLVPGTLASHQSHCRSAQPRARPSWFCQAGEGPQGTGQGGVLPRPRLGPHPVSTCRYVGASVGQPRSPTPPLSEFSVARGLSSPGPSKVTLSGDLGPCSWAHVYPSARGAKTWVKRPG